MSKPIESALVVSGGGAMGAWGGGVAQYLVEKEHRNYDLFVGTSTGSLMIPLIALPDFGHLKTAYTSVNQDDIFNVNPFKKNGDPKVGMLVWRAMRGKRSMGESLPLKKIIDQFLPVEYFNKINEDKEFVACTTNYTDNVIAYKSSKDNKYEDMKDWMWASANSPMFMSVLEKDGKWWTDGGLIEYVGIEYAIKRGARKIDVIIHQTRHNTDQPWKGKNLVDVLMRIIGVFAYHTFTSNVEVGKLEAHDKDVELNLYFMKEMYLKHNPLMFNKEKMKKWWDAGYAGEFDHTPHLIPLNR